MNYKTIAALSEASFTEKKSEFIGYICPVETEEEAIAFINEIRAMHRKATHNCYAYILRHNNTARHSDDGEPSGTAGVPMHEVLAKEGLTDVCCVVTRYFGGILLGAGGLVRAYSKGVKIAIDSAKIKNMCDACEIEIGLDYSLYGRIGATFAEYDARIAEESFTDSVFIRLFLRVEQAERFKADLIELCNGRISVQIKQTISYDFG
ncbi:MAG: YigZ family protein [Ruminiclostridium sp.]